MLNAELIELIKQHSFAQAALRLRSERSQLKTVSVAHPIFDLLYCHAQSNAGYYFYKKISKEQKTKEALHMLDLFSAMLDAGTDHHMELSSQQVSAATPANSDRVNVGFSSHRGHYASSCDHLYVRLAGLDWPQAMDVLLSKGYYPPGKTEFSAIVNAISKHAIHATDYLLKRYTPKNLNDYHFEKITTPLFTWPSAPPDLVGRVMQWIDHPNNKSLLSWVYKAASGVYNDLTCVQWMDGQSGKWDHVHLSVWKTWPDNTPRPALWCSLFREYVQTGGMSTLVSEALESQSFQLWKNEPLKNGAGLVSWLAQGSAMQAPQQENDYAGLSQGLPTQSMAIQLRRTVKLIKRMTSAGCHLRTPGDKGMRTEAMDWASRGWCPSPACVRRHPEIVLPSRVAGETPQSTAATVDVALKWESAGSVSVVDNAGFDPWVASMNRSPVPASWAKEIFNRLRDGRIDVDAMGTTNRPLSVISVRSPPLARFWLKRSKRHPDEHMVKAAVENASWGLLREWIAAGFLDHDRQSVRHYILRQMTSPPPHYSTTDNSRKQWQAMIMALTDRPGKPWPDQMTLWRETWGHNHGPPPTGNDMAPIGLKALANWNNGQLVAWDGADMDRYSNVLSYSPDWINYMPVAVSEENAIDLFWHVMHNEKKPRLDRYNAAQRLVDHMSGYLPIENAGRMAFEKLCAVNNKNPGNSWDRRPSGMQEFLDRAQLMAGTEQMKVHLQRPTPSRF